MGYYMFERKTEVNWIVIVAILVSGLLFFSVSVGHAYSLGGNEFPYRINVTITAARLNELIQYNFTFNQTNCGNTNCSDIRVALPNGQFVQHQVIYNNMTNGVKVTESRDSSTWVLFKANGINLTYTIYFGNNSINDNSSMMLVYESDFEKYSVGAAPFGWNIADQLSGGCANVASAILSQGGKKWFAANSSSACASLNMTYQDITVTGIPNETDSGGQGGFLIETNGSNTGYDNRWNAATTANMTIFGLGGPGTIATGQPARTAQGASGSTAYNMTLQSNGTTKVGYFEGLQDVIVNDATWNNGTRVYVSFSANGMMYDYFAVYNLSVYLGAGNTTNNISATGLENSTVLPSGSFSPARPTTSAISLSCVICNGLVYANNSATINVSVTLRNSTQNGTIASVIWELGQTYNVSSKNNSQTNFYFEWAFNSSYIDGNLSVRVRTNTTANGTLFYNSSADAFVVHDTTNNPSIRRHATMEGVLRGSSVTIDINVSDASLALAAVSEINRITVNSGGSTNGTATSGNGTEIWQHWSDTNNFTRYLKNGSYITSISTSGISEAPPARGIWTNGSEYFVHFNSTPGLVHVWGPTGGETRNFTLNVTDIGDAQRGLAFNGTNWFMCTAKPNNMIRVYPSNGGISTTNYTIDGSTSNPCVQITMRGRFIYLVRDTRNQITELNLDGGAMRNISLLSSDDAQLGFTMDVGDDFWALNESIPGYQLYSNRTRYENNWTLQVIYPNGTLASMFNGTGNVSLVYNTTSVDVVGNYTLNLTARDAAGNVNSTQSWFGLASITVSDELAWEAGNYTSSATAWGNSIALTNGSVTDADYLRVVQFSWAGICTNCSTTSQFNISNNFTAGGFIVVQVVNNVNASVNYTVSGSNLFNWTSDFVNITSGTKNNLGRLRIRVPAAWEYARSSIIDCEGGGFCPQDGNQSGAFYHRILARNVSSRIHIRGAFVRVALGTEQTLDNTRSHFRYNNCNQGNATLYSCTVLGNSIDILDVNNGNNQPLMGEITGPSQAKNTWVFMVNMSDMLVRTILASPAMTGEGGGGLGSGSGGGPGVTSGTITSVAGNWTQRPAVIQRFLAEGSKSRETIVIDNLNSADLIITASILAGSNGNPSASWAKFADYTFLPSETTFTIPGGGRYILAFNIEVPASIPKGDYDFQVVIKSQSGASETTRVDLSIGKLSLLGIFTIPIYTFPNTFIGLKTIELWMPFAIVIGFFMFGGSVWFGKKVFGNRK